MEVESLPHEPEENDKCASDQSSQDSTSLSSNTVNLHFEVQDTGVGIAPEELNKVFDAFVQTESGRQSRQGTGLGLPISREYVRMMGGYLTVRSEPGKGSRFQFNIQADLPNQAEIDLFIARTSPRRVLGLEAGQQAPDGSPYRILVVEDIAASRRLLVNLLQPLGFAVEAATNGQESIEIWENWHPHLIFMDIGMPVMDGYQATKEIKARAANRATTQHPTPNIQPVIIALTASAFEEEREAILAEGCDDFVRKPFREAQIFTILEKHLGLRFVYEEIVSEVIPERSKTTLKAILASMPEDWLAKLQHATTLLDARLILQSIAQIEAEHPELAASLTELVGKFEYKQILDMLP